MATIILSNEKISAGYVNESERTDASLSLVKSGWELEKIWTYMGLERHGPDQIGGRGGSGGWGGGAPPLLPSLPHLSLTLTL